MKKIETKDITNWGVAKKTKNIKAKPLISIMVDKNVTNKFLVDTLEGREPLGDGSIICIGESNDVWQQMPKKLLQKYSVIEIDNDGWMICEPRPDNSVNCVEVTSTIFPEITGHFYIIGQHIPGCDTEICPKCGLQIISCGCFINDQDEFDEIEFNKYEPDIWTGIMFEKELQYAEDHDLFVDINTMKPCDKNDPNAFHDINSVVSIMINENLYKPNLKKK